MYNAELFFNLRVDMLQFLVHFLGYAAHLNITIFQSFNFLLFLIDKFFKALDQLRFIQTALKLL